MKLLEEINIMANKKLVILLNVACVILLFPMLFIFTWIASLITRENGFEFIQTQLWQLFALLFLFIFLLVIHELIHGLFFKFFKPDNKLKFGIKWKALMAYATSPGSRYTRKQMLVIGLAPFVLISLGLTVLLYFGILNGFVYIFLAAMHAAGCVGDFYYTYLLAWKYRKIEILAEDSVDGLQLRIE